MEVSRTGGSGYYGLMSGSPDTSSWPDRRISMIFQTAHRRSHHVVVFRGHYYSWSSAILFRYSRIRSRSQEGVLLQNSENFILLVQLGNIHGCLAILVLQHHASASLNLKGLQSGRTQHTAGAGLQPSRGRALGFGCSVRGFLPEY